MYHLVNCATATGRQVNETAAEAKDVLKSAGQVMHQGAAVVPPGVWTMFHADEDRLETTIKDALRLKSKTKACQALSQANVLLTQAKRYTEAARAQGSAEFQTYSAWPHAPSILTHSPAASHTPSHHTAAPLPLLDDRGYFQTAGPGQAMWAAPSPPSAFLNPGYDDPSLVQHRKMFMSAPGLSQVSPSLPVTYVQNNTTYNIYVGSTPVYPPCHHGY